MAAPHRAVRQIALIMLMVVVVVVVAAAITFCLQNHSAPRNIQHVHRNIRKHMCGYSERTWLLAGREGLEPRALKVKKKKKNSLAATFSLPPSTLR
jgi:hypothetical protein